eukprot:352805-Chlamydomonas_euryale.AAC.4
MGGPSCSIRAPRHAVLFHSRIATRRARSPPRRPAPCYPKEAEPLNGKRERKRGRAGTRGVPHTVSCSS